MGKEITGWIDHNKKLVIVLASVIGGILVILILSCCMGSYRKRQRMRKAQEAYATAQASGWGAANQGARPPGNQWPPNMSGGGGFPDNSGRWEGERWVPQPPQQTWQPSYRYG